MTGSWALLPVIEGGKLIGVLELDNLSEYISIHEPAQST
jgi:putative methionine-R-sulfoxide reductase with GAF domain